MKTKIGIRVMPREVILDPQGRAVENSLKSQGHVVNHVRVGKWIELEIESDISSAKEKVKSFAVEAGLVNPLIENFEVQVIESGVSR